MQEQRRNPRFSAENVYIACTMILAKTVEILNISIEGVSLQSDKRLELDRQYRLKIGCEEDVIFLDGVVVWSVLNGSIKTFKGEIAPIYRAGVRFKNIDTKKRTDLKHFVNDRMMDEQICRRNDGLSTPLRNGGCTAICLKMRH